jgi:hypothetical protein
MLSTKEIEEYVHGQIRSPEKQQFSFGEAEKIGDATMALAAKVTKAEEVMFRLRSGGLRKMCAMKRNILLILLFLVVFAVMFVLESRESPAILRHEISQSKSAEVHEGV